MCGKEREPLFLESKTLFSDWREKVAEEGLSIRIGRWNIPGNPIVMLVDFPAILLLKMKSTQRCGTFSRLIPCMRTVITMKKAYVFLCTAVVG